MGGKTNAGPMMPYQGSTTVQSIPPEVLARYNAVNARAEAAAAQPFQKYSSDTSAFVAPLTQTQQAGISNVNAIQGMAQPYYQAGTGAIGQGMGAYQQGLGALQGIAPQMAADQSVAGISTPFYQTAQRYTQTAATAPGGFQAGTPYLGVGAGLAGGAAQMTSPVGQEQINRYMSPYLQAVADPTMAFMKQQQEQQMAGQTGQAIRQGAFGGDRAGIAAATLAAQQQMAGAKTYGDIMQQGYGQALGSAFQAQQAQQADLARQLAAGQAMGQFGATAGQLQQADLARQLQAGAQMGQLGTAQRQAYEAQQQIRLQDLARQMQGAGMMGQMGAGLGALGQAYGQMGAGAQQAALQGAQAQLSAGTLEQQTGQAGLQALYNQFLQERGYPYQQAQFLANIAMGTGALSGGTTTGYTSQQAQYQPLFQGFSDERLKEGLGAAKGGRRHVPPEVVGKTFDGQNIYRYKKIYRDEPELGLMADEVEDRHPEAVGRSHGYQTVDYKRATDDAVRLGGAVTSGGDFARGGYADGGMPIGEHVTERYIDPSSFDADMRRILASQKAGLGKLGAGLTGGVYGGAGTGTPGSSGYVPQGGLSAPSRANLPEAMRVSAVQSAPERSSGLSKLSNAVDFGQKLFDPEAKGLLTKESPFEREGASNWAKAKSVLGLFKPGEGKALGGVAYALGGASTGYDKEAGEEDPIGEALKVAQTPSKSNIPSPQAESPRRGSSEKGGFLDDLGSAVDTGSKLVSIGTAAAKLAPFLMSMSDRRMKEGLGRAAFQDGGPEDSNKAEYKPSDRDLDYLTRTLVKEAYTEGPAGMEAVGHVALNRQQSGKYGPDIASVVTAPKQFSPWNREAIGTKADPRLLDPASKPYQEARAIAQRVLSGESEDPTGGALNFYNPDLANPKWGAGLKNAMQIGHHRFGTAEGEGASMPDLSKLGPRERSFLASENAAPPQGLSNAAAVAEPRKKLGFMEDIEQNPQHLIVPFLSGLGAMARSQSRQPIGAILEGLGAGAERYMEVPRIEEETEKIRREQALTTANALESGARAEKVPAETLETLQRARSLSLQNLGSAENPNWVVYLADGTVKPLYDWMDTGEPLVGGQEAARYAQSVGQTMKRSGTTLQPTTTSVAGVTPPGAPAQRTEKAPALKTEPTPITKPISTPIISGAGYVFDDDSSKKAAQETRAISGLDPALVREESRNYRKDTNDDALSANQQKIFYNEMANVISAANMGKGLSAPGKGFEITADITAGLNRALRAIPNLDVPENFFGEGAKYRDIMSKLTTLQAQARASGADQRALGALVQNLEALPSLSKEPEAGAQIAASNMITNQKAIDRKGHADQWGKYSRGIYANAATDFEAKNDAAKYSQEQKAIEKMLLDKGDKKDRIAPGYVVFDLMKENKVKPQDINDYFEKRYGIPKERNMARYFVGRS